MANAEDIRHVGSIPRSGRPPCRREWQPQPTPIFLPGEFHGRRSVAGYNPWGCKELDVTERLTHLAPIRTLCSFCFLSPRRDPAFHLARVLESGLNRFKRRVVWGLLCPGIWICMFEDLFLLSFEVSQSENQA